MDSYERRQDSLTLKILSVTAFLISTVIVIGISILYLQKSDVAALSESDPQPMAAVDVPATSWTAPQTETVDPATKLELETLITTPASIDPLSISIQTFDFENDGSDEYVVYFHKDLTAAEQRLAPDHDWKGAFRIYREVANTWTLYYEYESKVGQPMYNGESLEADNFFTPADLDQDGTPEVIISTRADGTGSYTNQFVLKSVGRGLISEVEVVETKTGEEVAELLLKTGESLGAGGLNVEGGGYIFICPAQGNCNIRQSGPNAVGQITYDLIYRDGKFETANYTRQDF